ncbi:peptidase [Vibrio cholerae]|nr:peptidase [Vibrio cholerae]
MRNIYDKWLLLAIFLSGCANIAPRERHFTSYIESKFYNVNRQQLDMSCGLAALSDVFIYRYNEHISEMELLERAGLKPIYSFLDLQTLAESYGKLAKPIWIEYDKLELITEPAIFYLERKGNKHFVSLSYVDKNHIQIKDPAWGGLNYTREQFEEYWIDKSTGKGRALVFINKARLSSKFVINDKVVWTDNSSLMR